MNATVLPTTIPDYLEQLRRSLAGADPALVQDALYDAEEYLRSELSEHPGKSEAEVIAAVASSYGAPDEVADIYRDTEVKVQSALRTPPARPAVANRSWFSRFFGVIAEPRTYAALFYMLLALATGIFYFTWVVTGISLSGGLAVLIIGIPFVILYFGSVRVLSLVEGRIVEVMLGERMPRRPLYSTRGKPLLERIKELFTDPRTWATQLYFLLMLPLGIAYFTVAVTGLATSLGLIAAPVAALFGGFNGGLWVDEIHVIGVDGWWALPLCLIAGVVLLFATLHLARAVGHLHGQLAKHMLVKSAQYE
ncbi:sensor domain-containing protein [Lysobacter niabensis]|uniref:sensor domain-containing protein n=1 Tax=Agrilutibacter niabensis TaxID=380628 RepID=UPI003606964B